MTGPEFEKAITALGLNQTSVGQLLEKNGRTIRRWVQDGVSEPMIVVLLKLLTDGAVSIEDVVRIKAEEGISTAALVTRSVGRPAHQEERP